MKNIKIVLILIISLVLNIQSFAQKKLNKLTNYAGRDYVIIEKGGLLGLKSKKGDLIVPANYDLVLPAFQQEFSFIVKKGNLGLYDNKMNQEVVIEEGHTLMNLYKGYDNSYVLVFGNENDNYSEKVIYYALKRDSTKAITPVKKSFIGYNYLPKTNSGIEKTGDSNIIHRFSQVVTTEDTEGYEIIDFTNSIQKTGVYSLAQKEFTVTPQFINFYISFDYNSSEQITYFDYYQATKLDETTKGSIFLELRLYSLYSLSFIELVSPKPEVTWPISGGGYYRKTLSDSLYVYSNANELVLALSGIIDVPNSVNFAGSLIYIGSNYDDDGVNEEMGMYLKEYQIYSKKGKLRKNEKFEIDFDTGSSTVKSVTVQDPKDEWDFLKGFYDIEKAEYVIKPIYDEIQKIYFKEYLVKCLKGNCNYYFLLKKGGKLSYLDQNLNSFIPIGAIPDLVYEEFSVDIYAPSVLERMPYIEIYPIDTLSMGYGVLKKKGIEVKFEFFEEEFFSMDSYVGLVYATYGNAKIVEMYDAYQEAETDAKPQPTYGLISKNQAHLYLPPFFEKMEFNLETKTLEFTYRGETGSILLERYEY